MRWMSWMLAGAFVLASPAQAVEYAQVQLDKSTILFGYQQMGVKMDGRFKKFSAQLNFDPAKPAAAQASLTVDLASVDAGSADADDEVVGKPWFNVKAFPSAQFVAKQFKAAGANRYDVSGTLTIKGKSQDITVPTTLTQQGAQAVFEGAFVIKRGDFNIGEGSWSKFDIVANDVNVRFKIVAAGR